MRFSGATFRNRMPACVRVALSTPVADCIYNLQFSSKLQPYKANQCSIFSATYDELTCAGPCAPLTRARKQFSWDG